MNRMMSPRLFLGLTLSTVIVAAPGRRIGASPFIPIEWQQRVKSGPLEEQRKHANWIRDLNVNFIDDALDAMDPGETTTVILQMNECLTPAEAAARFGALGAIRRIGTLVSYIVLDGVKVADLPAIAADDTVAAIEKDELVFATLDTGTREVRARASNTYSPETFADAFGFDGTGINVAIVDTGVDDAVHAAFAGKFVSGYNALTATAGNPNDDNFSSTYLTTGEDGICDTTAAGDDSQLVAVGFGFPDPNAYSFPVRAILPGANGVINTTAAGDDVASVNPCDGSPYIAPGPDGICDTIAAGDDLQAIPVGQGGAHLPGILAGGNGAVDTLGSSDDIVFPGVWHGTHVAGTVAGLGVGPGCRPADDGSGANDCRGVAPGAGIVDVKALNSGGSGTIAGIIDGLEWIWMDGNARVVNMSLGTDTPSDGTDTISKVINSLVANGISVAVAAGNSGGNCLGAVAASELAVTVAAADDRGTVDRDDDAFASFSTFGPRLDFDPTDPTVGQLKPDITAPGVNSTSAEGDTAGLYHALDGTSQATPYVAGAIALLLDMNPAIPPGSLKDLLKRSAYITPEHAALGASYPAIDGAYNIHWGFGLLDVYQAASDLSAGIADISFTACGNPGCGTTANCDIPGYDYANSTDIQLATDPPVQGEPNTISVVVENRDAVLAQGVVVCVGVKELGAGLNQFYDVGCKTTDIGAGATVVLNFPWTPTLNSHQCIQATIDYGFDKEFCNNQTQRNTDPVPASSTAVATFRVENPFNETAQIVLTPQFVAGNDAIQGRLRGQATLLLKPEDCPVLEEMEFTPNPGTPKGSTATWVVNARATTASNPDGVELSGVVFNVEVVPAGLLRAYSIGRHAAEGLIRLPLSLAQPTSDPRSQVTEILAVFNVTVKSTENLSPSDVSITSAKGSQVPSYTVAFETAGNSGKELTILFSQPLADQDRYTFDFGRLVDTDGDALDGDKDFELRVLAGDVNNSGAVTATDISFVRSRINRLVEFGDTSKADVNLTGGITGPDVSFVRARIGHSTP